MTRVADRALLDTNVLLAATDQARRTHHSSLAVLNEWPAQGVVLYTSGQILREYLGVATRPIAHNGLGLTLPDALDNVQALRGRLHCLAETDKVHDRLLELLGDVPCTGKQVHDANIVATALVHGIDTIATNNLADFTQFGKYVRALPPG